MSGDPVTLADVKAYLEAHELSPLIEDHQAEGWVRREVEVASLRECHGSYKHRQLPGKGIRFICLVARHREEIKAGRYPAPERPWLAEDIMRAWGVEPSLIVVLEDRKGDLYVMDGAQRTHNAVWTGRNHLDAFVFCDQGEREAPECW